MAMDHDLAADQRGLGHLASFAIELAMAARRETLRLSSEDSPVVDKGRDGVFDPVTEADRAAEKAMRELIEQRYPAHGICGEEFAAKTTSSQYQWSLDPIDGTRSYMCGLPNWTTLIGLVEKGEPVLGLIDAPSLNETYVGFDNEAAIIRNGERAPIRTSSCKHVNEARFSTTDPFLFGEAEGALQRILRAVRVTRFGHDGYGYARLAAGSIDLVIECGLKPHDYNPLIPVIRAAGGHIGDWNGSAQFADGNVIAAASRELYDEAVELFAAK
jgi:myo-inositol-1(or 4)-monophosphatase